MWSSTSRYDRRTRTVIGCLARLVAFLTRVIESGSLDQINLLLVLHFPPSLFFHQYEYIFHIPPPRHGMILIRFVIIFLILEWYV
eukprot:scaffold220569_cov20-Prasinocladus_malaysianus.AAC.1